MDQQAALAFLKQPLPAEPSAQQKEQLGDVIMYFHEHPTVDAIMPLFESIQDWDDTDIFESIVFYLRHFEVDQFKNILAQLLTHDRNVVRMWASSAATRYPHPAYLPALATHMDSPDDNTRFSAACAIESIGGEEARNLARLYLPLERNDEIYDSLRTTVEARDED